MNSTAKELKGTLNRAVKLARELERLDNIEYPTHRDREAKAVRVSELSLLTAQAAGNIARRSPA